jgi:hypothetical protein
MITTLAILFLLLLVGLVLYGYGIVMRRAPTDHELQTEKCSLCLQRFPQSELVERQIGDYKLMFFCERCITTLQVDLEKRKDGKTTKTSDELEWRAT